MKTYNDLPALVQRSFGVTGTKSGANNISSRLKTAITFLFLPFIFVVEKIAFILSISVIVVALTMAALASIVAARASHA